MKKILICLVVCIIAAAAYLAMASEENVDTIDHQITIVTQEDSLSVTEVLTIQGDAGVPYENLTVWIQDNAENVNILVNSNTIEDISINENEYVCNISSLSITEADSTQVKITYNLNKNVEFTKKVVRNTNSISVKVE